MDRTKEQWISLLASFARPFRIYVWVVVIVVIACYVLFTGGVKDEAQILYLVVTGIFADLGVTGISRTIEKNTRTKALATQKAVETVTNPETNTNIENMNIGNENVTTGTKKKEDIQFE